jgi:hypothetical protein
MTENEMKARFEELAPWRVNGTLAANDREWVDTYVRDHPEAAAELQWYTSLQDRIRESAPAIGDEYGWDRLHQRIQAERPVRRPTLSERLGSLLSAFTPRPVLAYAAMALVVVQAGVIGVLMVEKDKQETEFSNYRTWIASGQSQQVLRLSFKPETTERQIRGILVGVGGTLIGGPNQLGDYYLYVSPEQIEPVRDKLAANQAVETVDIITAIPNRD